MVVGQGKAMKANKSVRVVITGIGVVSPIGIGRDAFWRKYGVTLALYAMGRAEEAERDLEKFINQYESEAAVQIAEIKAYSGAADEAFEWLDRAVAQRDPGVSALIGNPLFENLLEDPRWPALLKRLGFPEPGAETPD